LSLTGQNSLFQFVDERFWLVVMEWTQWWQSGWALRSLLLQEDMPLWALQSLKTVMDMVPNLYSSLRVVSGLVAALVMTRPYTGITLGFPPLKVCLHFNLGCWIYFL